MTSILGEVITAITVRVYERIMPLRMQPRKGQYGSQESDSFVEKVFHPLLQSETGDSKGKAHASSSPQAEQGSSEEEVELGPEYCEVERILDKRTRGGELQYKVKWKGWNHRYDSWRDAEDMECQELIEQYESEFAGLCQGELRVRVQAMVLCLAATGSVMQPEVSSSYSVGTGLGECNLSGINAEEAVSRLMARQRLQGTVSEYVPGYRAELQHMVDRRLRQLSPEEEARVRLNHPVVTLRMIPEAKKDGRRKARLVLQGFKEPREWDVGSNVSPVAYPSTIRSLVFMGGNPDDILSSIDVSVAFLQSTEYGTDEAPRYVSYKPYAGAREYLFQLRGPVYGQRSAPRAWYSIVSEWLIDDMGYRQGKNEPCVFRHPETGHRLVLFCDDFLCRGSR